jgi:Uma2 family endonuclease
MVTTKLVTAEELEAMDEDARYELIRGELRPMSPVGDPHGTLLFRVGSPVDRHINENLLGRLSGGDVGIILESDPDTVLAPDMAFFRELPRVYRYRGRIRSSASHLGRRDCFAVRQ